MKNLIYYVIGVSPEYHRLLEFSLHTLLLSGNSNNDILVMCDKDYFENIKHLPINYFLITEKNETPMQASMRKVNIFDFEFINNYSKVLYLDSDIIINGSLNVVFDLITRKDVLYVVQNGDSSYHRHYFYSCLDDPYDDKTIEMLIDKKIGVFNAGQYGFCVSEDMRKHFDQLKRNMLRFDPSSHFYEQSFMNNYFNPRLLIDYSIEPFVCLYDYSNNVYENRINIINHVCNERIPFKDKLDLMIKLYYNNVSISSDVSFVTDTRDNIGLLVRLPFNPHIAEIGVFRGQFSEILYKTYRPKKFHLVDPWNGDLISGDKNGNNISVINGEHALAEVRSRFSNINNIVIHRKFSNDIISSDIPDSSLDLIYIDGDHSYQGVYNDLCLAWRLVKRGGWIAGHDYSINSEKTKEQYDFGVKRAVDQFCQERSMRIYAFFNDGCVSYVMYKNT